MPVGNLYHKANSDIEKTNLIVYVKYMMGLMIGLAKYCINDLNAEGGVRRQPQALKLFQG